MILIMVLSFFLLISGIVVEETSSINSTTRIFEKIYLKEECYYQAQAAFNSYISYFLRYKKKKFDSLNEFWALPYTIPIEDGKIEITVWDEESRFNVNTITKPYGLEVLKRLFRELEISSINPDKIYTWITGKGFWDRKMPPKSLPMNSLGELLFIGMSERDFYGKTIGFKAYPGVEDVLTVWGDGKVNINTASRWVLKALFPPEYQDVVDEVIDYRSEHPFKKVQDLLMVSGVDFNLFHIISPWIKVKSSYFSIDIKVQRGGVEGELISVIEITGSKAKIVSWRFT